jgi:hypothetical protein
MNRYLPAMQEGPTGDMSEKFTLWFRILALAQIPDQRKKTLIGSTYLI